MKSGDRLYIGIRRVPIWRISMETWFHHWSGSSIKSGLAWNFWKIPPISKSSWNRYFTVALCVWKSASQNGVGSEKTKTVFSISNLKGRSEDPENQKLLNYISHQTATARAVRSHKNSYEKTCRDRDKSLMFFPGEKNSYFSMVFGVYAGI